MTNQKHQFKFKISNYVLIAYKLIAHYAITKLRSAILNRDDANLVHKPLSI